MNGISSLPSYRKPDGRVIVTLWRTTDALTGQTGAAAVASADAAGTVEGSNLLSRVPEATSVEICDTNHRVLAVCVRNSKSYQEEAKDNLL